MSNLLQETKNVLESNLKTPEDIKWIGSADGKFSINWKLFEQISNFEYNGGYGGQEVVSDLVIVGTDWWLSRGEYDGSEWWDFNSKPIRERKYQKFTRLTDPQKASWVTIEEAGQEGGKYGTE